jgi:hypothetical protein
MSNTNIIVSVAKKISFLLQINIFYGRICYTNGTTEILKPYLKFYMVVTDF